MGHSTSSGRERSISETQETSAETPAAVAVQERTTTRQYYFFRGEMIERFGPGWAWSEEMERGNDSGPIYRTVEDARNAIRKSLDSSHTAEPRVIGTWKWNGHGWVVG